MKILHCGLEYSYWGILSEKIYEHVHFVDTWKTLGIEVDTIDIKAYNKEDLNHQIALRAPDYDMLFYVIYQDELALETMLGLSNKVLRAGFQTDDHWRFDSISRTYGPHFDWWVTTVKDRLPDYQGLPIHPIYMPWGVNTDVYKKYELISKEPEPHLHWFGQVYGDREEKIRVFNGQVPLIMHGFYPLNELISQMNRASLILNLSSGFIPTTKAIKGRLFEVPAVGTLLITENAPYTEEFYEPGKEIVVFDSIEEGIEKAKYYLSHPEEGAKIAQAGYDRTIKDHSYKNRFSSLFREMGIL
jgi:spore maturation protein CgeB